MAYTLRENWTNTSSNKIPLDATTDHAGQTFQATSTYLLSKIELYLFRGNGDDAGNLTVEIQGVDGGGDPDGNVLSSSNPVDSTTLMEAAEAGTTGGEWIAFTFSPTSITNGDNYAIVLKSSAANSSNVVYWRLSGTEWGGTGARNFSSDGGSTWSGPFSNDFLFKNYSFPTPPSDKTYSRKLIAFGGNELWYESSGSMVELSAASEDINTSEPINVAELGQKLFIANGSNLKVADFANVSISTSNVGAGISVAPSPAVVLVGGTSGAEMVVDYCSNYISNAIVYGWRTSTATFLSGETVTGTNEDGNTVSFTLDAAETSGPLWYDWKVFNNYSTDYGTMPSEAKLCCRYRGRMVLSGHRDYPHQWWMSRTSKPFDWKFVEDDPLTPVAGNNADAGQIGDIVTALIPFGDDFLIFGCANSIHLLTGDPAYGGSIDEIDQTTGIWGDRAWCKDSNGNLYFFGSRGIYRMDGGRSKPFCISQGALPKIIEDWAYTPETHRITLSFVVERIQGTGIPFSRKGSIRFLFRMTLDLSVLTSTTPSTPIIKTCY